MLKFIYNKPICRNFSAAIYIHYVFFIFFLFLPLIFIIYKTNCSSKIDFYYYTYAVCLFFENIFLRICGIVLCLVYEFALFRSLFWFWFYFICCLKIVDFYIFLRLFLWKKIN